MRFGKSIRIPVLTFATALLAVTSAAAQQIRYPDFSNLADVANLQRNGVSHIANWQGKVVLRATNGATPTGMAYPEASSTYFKLKQPLVSGFTTYFSFQMHAPVSIAGPGDGIAFIIQNSSSTESLMGASGAGLTSLGAGSVSAGKGGLGYAGISNSLAVELDIDQDPWDPSGNHVAIQSCGPLSTIFNTPVHLDGTYTIGDDTDVTSCLVSNAITSGISTLADGNIHYAVIEYDPPTGKTPGLSVWVDPTFIQGTHTPLSPPVLSIPYVIDGANGLMLDNGAAWVGFTASQSSKALAQDILAWEFTPHDATKVQEKIKNDGTATMFTFGGHEAKVTYPKGTQVDGKYMTVLATPIDPKVFYDTRLKGTQFQNETCITYLETGGNCILYTVTCQAADKVTQVPCPATAENVILTQSAYYTSQNVTNDNADLLKADPIGTNNWVSICDPKGVIPPCYQPNVFDGTTSGKGNNFSDIVATYAPLLSHPGPALTQNLPALPAKQAVLEAKREGK